MQTVFAIKNLLNDIHSEEHREVKSMMINLALGS